jgi:hypothetical protein
VGFSSLTGKKTDNHDAARGAKIGLRRRVLAAVPGPRVFDAFAGRGSMYRNVWHQAEHYVGCDSRWIGDDRPAYVADNHRVLRCIDLRQFNIFDLDAYGSPWDQAYIIAERRPVKAGEVVGFVFTDGSSLGLRSGALPRPLAALAGLSGPVAGAHALQDEILRMAVKGLGAKMGAQLLEWWSAKGKSGASVRYLGAVYRGLK